MNYTVVLYYSSRYLCVYLTKGIPQRIVFQTSKTMRRISVVAQCALSPVTGLLNISQPGDGQSLERCRNFLAQRSKPFLHSKRSEDASTTNKSFASSSLHHHTVLPQRTKNYTAAGTDSPLKILRQVQMEVRRARQHFSNAQILAELQEILHTVDLLRRQLERIDPLSQCNPHAQSQDILSQLPSLMVRLGPVHFQVATPSQLVRLLKSGTYFGVNCSHVVLSCTARLLDLHAHLTTPQLALVLRYLLDRDETRSCENPVEVAAANEFLKILVGRPIGDLPLPLARRVVSLLLEMDLRVLNITLCREFLALLMEHYATRMLQVFLKDVAVFATAIVLLECPSESALHFFLEAVPLTRSEVSTVSVRELSFIVLAFARAGMRDKQWFVDVGNIIGMQADYLSKDDAGRVVSAFELVGVSCTVLRAVIESSQRMKTLKRKKPTLTL